MRSLFTDKWLVCRICLRQPKEVMSAIFDSQSDKDLTKMILECGGVPIKQYDHYPDKICSKCKKLLRIAHKFRVLCQRSHNHLSKFIAPVEVDTISTTTETMEPAAATPTTTNDEIEDDDQSLEQDDDFGNSTDDTEAVTTTTTTTTNKANNEILLAEEEEGYTEEVQFKGATETYEFNDDDEQEVLEEDNDQELGGKVDFKKELSDVDEDGNDNEEIVDIYEPIDMDYVEIFEDMEEEHIERSNSGLSEEIEYLEDIIKEELTSDDEFLPTTKPKQKSTTTKPGARTRGRPKGSKNLKTVSPFQSRTFKIKKEPEKRGRKPKNPNVTLYICDICGNTYPTQGRLTEHIKLHNGVKPHECEICGHTFAQTQQLARHMNTHTGNRPYKCNYCTAAFADLSTRNKHHRIHTNERPYVCDVCGKAFSYTNTLKFHKMIHTGEKPFVCDICGKGFPQAYKLRNHKMTHAKRGVMKNEKIEIDSLVSFQEVHDATAQIVQQRGGGGVGAMKQEKIEIDTLVSFQEVHDATAQILEI